ncbi:MAG: fumarylacetoacetate hydrolase family protein [Ilumatobacteraceae bacterium]|nr:fumarylacetoacetate hydrolase family protein [Ilumatobacteraceae bacterium]
MGFRFANVAGRAALVRGDHYYDVATVSNGSLSSEPMKALGFAAQLSALSSTLADPEPAGLVADVVLDAPVPHPQKSFGIGLNYADHAAEGSMDVPANPLVFTKFPSCLVGPTANVEQRSDFCDYEGELVVVIGRGGKDIAVESAWDHVVGMTVGEDISDRKAQFASKPPHFDLGKSFDTFGPIGPVLVSTDEIADPGALRIVTTINGEEQQNDTVSNLIFDIPTLINYLSQITTLVTGDVIFTGTPSGIGAARGVYLRDGDVIVTTIDGIGTMTNRCVRVSDHHSPGD